MTMFRLMIKTHNITGLKYLCKTEREDWQQYLGSGKRWLYHLNKHGENISTTLLLETNDKNKFKKIAKSYSKKYDVINSKEWANLVEEQGDGGNTVSNKFWITNGTKEKYLEKGSKIPKGWKQGRGPKCVFTNPKNQGIFGKMCDIIARGTAIKKAWDEGRIKRDHNKCGTKGNKNPAKRPEVKEKIRQWQLNRKPEYCNKCEKWFKNINVHKNRSNNHKNK